MEQWAKGLLAAWTSHEVEKVLSFYEDNGVFEDFALGRVMHGKEEIRTFIKESFTGFPDFKIEMKSFFASDGHICIEWISSGTHKGDLPGMPATGKSFSVPGVSVVELAQGKAKREADYWDSASMMRQLGLLPAAMDADPFVGTWKLNVAKSKSTEMPKSETMKYQAINNGLKGIIDGIDAEGEAFHLEFLVILDGKYYPIKDFPYLDMDSSQKIDASTILHVAKKAGREVENWRIAVSKDGETLTLTGKAITHKGQAFSGTRVFNRQ